MILHGIEYQRPTSLNMRILADHVTYSSASYLIKYAHTGRSCDLLIFGIHEVNFSFLLGMLLRGVFSERAF